MDTCWIWTLVLLLCLFQLSSGFDGCDMQVVVVEGNDAQLCCNFPPLSIEQNKRASKSIKKEAEAGDTTLHPELVEETGTDTHYSTAFWSHRGGTAWILTIRNTTDADHGRYICLAQVSSSMAPYSTSATLTVHIRPAIITDYDSQEVEPGQNVTLHCHVRGRPTPTIAWYRYDFMGGKIDLYYNEAEYKVPSVTLEEGGRYECAVNNVVGPADYKEFTLDVKFPLHVTMPYQHVIQSTGQDTTLQCIINANPPPIEAYWQRHGARIQSGDKYRVHSLQIGQYRTIVGVTFAQQKEDFGDYACSAQNSENSDYVSVKVDSSVGFKVNVSPKDILVDPQIRTPITISCGVSSSDELSWWWTSAATGERKRIYTSSVRSRLATDLVTSAPDKYRVDANFTLRLKRVGLGDQGAYTCSVAGMMNDTASLVIIEKPVCENRSPVFGSGGALQLMCSFKYHGNLAQAVVSWEHDRERYSSVRKDSLGSISGALLLDRAEDGEYRCSVSVPRAQYTDQCTIIVGLPAASRSAGLVGMDVGAEANAAQCEDDGTTVAAVFAGLLGILAVVLLLALVWMFNNYKQEIEKYNNPSRQKCIERDPNCRCVSSFAVLPCKSCMSRKSLQQHTAK